MYLINTHSKKSKIYLLPNFNDSPNQNSIFQTLYLTRTDLIFSSKLSSSFKLYTKKNTDLWLLAKNTILPNTNLNKIRVCV